MEAFTSNSTDSFAMFYLGCR